MTSWSLPLKPYFVHVNFSVFLVSSTVLFLLPFFHSSFYIVSPLPLYYKYTLLIHCIAEQSDRMTTNVNSVSVGQYFQAKLSNVDLLDVFRAAVG